MHSTLLHQYGSMLVHTTTESPCFMRVSLLHISLIGFFKTFQKGFAYALIEYVHSLLQFRSKNCGNQIRSNEGIIQKIFG